MSAAARLALVNSEHLFFGANSQRTDLLDDTLTRTELIALLQAVIDAGYHIELTAVRSDHHDDTDLHPIAPYTGTHAHGWAADLGVLSGPIPGDWTSDSSVWVQGILKVAAASPYLDQIGLAGDFYTPANVAAAGVTVFEDDGGPHIHVGAKPC